MLICWVRTVNYKKKWVAAVGGCQPQIGAPYRVTADQVLQRLGLAAVCQLRVVRGDGISQAWKMANAAKGATSQVALGLEGPWWKAREYFYPPLAQKVVILARGEVNPVVRAFSFICALNHRMDNRRHTGVSRARSASESS